MSLAPRLHRILACQQTLLNNRRELLVSKANNELMQFVISKDMDRDWLPTIHVDIELPDEIVKTCDDLYRGELKRASKYLTDAFELQVNVVRLYDEQTTVLRLGKPIKQPL